MTHRITIVAVGFLACTLLTTHPALAQTSDDVLVEIGDCAAIEAREDRLECYEERVQQALQDQDSAVADTTTARAPDARPPAVGLSFGADVSEEPVLATVTAVRELEPNALLITLDNGQIWRQNRPRRYRLDIGTEVSLRPTRWGPSYRLSDPEAGGFIQVERVK